MTFSPRVTVISVPVSDPERAREFYVDRLGFDLLRDDSSVPGMRWLDVRPTSGSVSFALVTWFDSMPPGSLRGVVLAVDDVDSCYAELAARGVAFHGPPTQRPWGNETVFVDPDGNEFVLQEPLATVQQS